MMGGMFNEDDFEEEEEVKHEIFVKKLAKDDPVLLVLRQKIIQGYREYMEKQNIERYLNMVEIFVRVATKAPYPLEML